MKALPQAEPDKQATKTLLHLLARVPELPALDVKSVQSMPAAHVAVWVQRLSATLPKLNGVAGVQGERRLVREAVMLAASEAPAVLSPESYLQRARAVARYVRDAAPELGAEMLEMVSIQPRPLIDALRAFEGTGRRRRGDTRPKRHEGLQALYRALRLGGHESQIRRRGTLELR